MRVVINSSAILQARLLKSEFLREQVRELSTT